MVRRSSWASWGRILGAIAGILWIISGILQLIGSLLSDKFTDILNTASWLYPLNNIVYAIVIIIIGVLILLLSINRFGLSYVIIGILLIVFAILSGGLPAILALIGGIFYIIAGV